MAATWTTEDPGEAGFGAVVVDDSERVVETVALTGMRLGAGWLSGAAEVGESIGTISD
jgi:hypothetical protein